MNCAVEPLRAPEGSIASTGIDELVFGEGVYDLSSEEFHSEGRAVIGQYKEKIGRESSLHRELASRDNQLSMELVNILPRVPTSAFKHSDITLDGCEIEKWCMSSGTSGWRSRIGRDRDTLERLLGSVRSGLAHFYEWSEEEMAVIHLGPSYEEAGDIWFPYVMSLTELLYPTFSFASGSAIDYESAKDCYFRLLASGQHVGVIGAPFAVRQFARHMREAQKPVRAGGSVFVLTAGGWKSHGKEEVPKDLFRAEIGDAFGLEDATCVRDAFNQVELNSVLIECSGHRLHIPPWMECTALDPATLGALPDGEIGLLSFIDASATSYPAAFVGDDIGCVSGKPCPCGRPGKLLTIVRRVDRGSELGCSAALASRYSKGTRHAF